jgi:hypothetical protein
MAKPDYSKQIITYNDLRGQFKRIEAYTDEELEATIAVLGKELPDAYRYLNFIDAYLERRVRRALLNQK